MKTKIIKIKYCVLIALLFFQIITLACARTGKDNPKKPNNETNQEDAKKNSATIDPSKRPSDQAQIFYRKFFLRSLAKLPQDPNYSFEESLDYSNLKTLLKNQFIDKDAARAFSQMVLRVYPLNTENLGKSTWDRLRFIEEKIFEISDFFLLLLKELHQTPFTDSTLKRSQELLCIDKSDLDKHQFRNILDQEKITTLPDFTKHWSKDKSCTGCHKLSDSQEISPSISISSLLMNQDEELKTLLHDCLVKKIFSSDINTSFNKINDPASQGTVLRTYNYRFLSSMVPKLHAIVDNPILNWPRKFFEIQLLKVSSELASFHSGILLDIFDWQNILNHSMFNQLDLEELSSFKLHSRNKFNFFVNAAFNPISLEITREHLEIAKFASSQFKEAVLKNEFTKCKKNLDSSCLTQLYRYLSGRSYDPQNTFFLNLAREIEQKPSYIHTVLYEFLSTPRFLEL